MTSISLKNQFHNQLNKFQKQAAAEETSSSKRSIIGVKTDETGQSVLYTKNRPNAAKRVFNRLSGRTTAERKNAMSALRETMKSPAFAGRRAVLNIWIDTLKKRDLAPERFKTFLGEN